MELTVVTEEDVMEEGAYWWPWDDGKRKDHFEGYVPNAWQAVEALRMEGRWWTKKEVIAWAVDLDREYFRHEVAAHWRPIAGGKGYRATLWVPLGDWDGLRPSRGARVRLGPPE